MWDSLFAVCCLALAIAVHLSGSEAVTRNLEPSAFSVVLTTLAVGPLVVRRRFPLSVLALTLVGFLLLVFTRNTVGASTLGAIVAFYTAVAMSSRRDVRIAVFLMAVGGVGAIALQPVDLSAGGAVIHLGVFTGAWVLAAGGRQRRERFEAEVSATEERALRQTSEERLRITRELHDIIGHSMSLMVVQAGVAEQLFESNPQQARVAIGEIGATGRASLLQMRQVLNVLRNDADTSGALPRTPMPTLAQLADLVAGVESAGLPVALSTCGAAKSHPPALELAAYRVVQEALTNCLKHAEASHARVLVCHEPHELIVTVSDDGRGFSTGLAPAGHGIAGMRERVTVYGGQLVTGAGPDGGFQVQARFPLTGDRLSTGGQS